MSAIIEAFSDFAYKLQEREDTKELQRVGRAVHLALGSEAAALAAVVPALTCILPSNANAQKSHGHEEMITTATALATLTSPQTPMKTSIATKPTETPPPVPVLHAAQSTAASIPTTEARHDSSQHSTPQTPARLSNENALNQLKHVFSTLCRAISSAERPVIVFFGDLERLFDVFERGYRSGMETGYVENAF